MAEIELLMETNETNMGGCLSMRNIEGGAEFRIEV